MKIILATITPLLMMAPAQVPAQQAEYTTPDGYVMPRIPDEAEKKAALMMAYELNGQSMVSMRMIDLTAPPPKPIATVPITPDSSIAPPKKPRR